MGAELTMAVEAFPINGSFVIARGAKTRRVVTVTLRDGAAVGRGECVPYARYGESADSVVAAIESIREQLEAGANRTALQRLLPRWRGPKRRRLRHVGPRRQALGRPRLSGRRI